MLPFGLKGFAWPNRASAEKNGKRRVVTPLVMQMHITECGAACLGSVLAYHGRWVLLNELRNRCEISRDGSTAAGISRAGRHYGLNCVGKSVNVGHLKGMPLPQILFWELNHFLILEGFEGNWVFLNDPAVGRRKLSWQEFAKGFSGIALHLTPKPEFQPGGTPPGILRRLPPWFEGGGGALAFVLACALIMAVLALSVPVALSLFIDRVLVGSAPFSATAGGGGLVGAALLVYGMSWMKQRCMQRLTARMSVIAGDRCMTRLLRLPLEYFSHRLAGELTDRVLSIDKVAKGLSNTFLDLLVELTMSAVFLVALFAYDPILAGIVLALAIPNALLARVISRMQVDEKHAVRREQGLLFGLGMLMLRQTDILRMTGADDGFFSRWSGHQARELEARQRFVEFSHINAALPGFFMFLAQAAVLGIGASQVMAGDMTLGTLVAIYILAAMFLAPVGRFVAFADDRQMLEIGLQRLEDITETEEDARFTRRHSEPGAAVTLNGQLRLAGHVELRNITFGYNRARPPLIRDFSLVIEPGQRVAVVGASGSGKSTVASLVSGAYAPWSGDILFDGHQRHEVPNEVIVRSLSMVDQNPVLFSATVRENITLWNSAVSDDIVIAAARDACIHRQVLDRPLGYETQVDEDGGNFSGGERQRLEIARALVNSPTVLILDEATSALDARTEKAVDNALRKRGVSCLIIAHRLSTIRDCDRIIVLDQGTEVQRGTHEELMMDSDGRYRRLVQAS